MCSKTQIKCPIKNCYKIFESNNILKDHLLLDHYNQINTIEEPKWPNLGLHQCKTCVTSIFTSKGALTRHTNTHHKNTRYTDKNNVERITEAIPVPPTSTHHWNESFTWLNNLKITPPPFRQNIWLKINKNTQTKIIHLYHRLLLVLINTPNTTSTVPIIPSMHKIEVIWKLVFIFESIILFPMKNKANLMTTSPTIEKRLHLLRTGNIKLLYEESRAVISLSPQEKKCKFDNMSESSTLQSAQLAANNDQYKSAISRLTQDTPVAINTPDIVKILEGLYPSKHIIQNKHDSNKQRNLTHHKKEIDIDRFINIISKTPKARAAGPFGDISDIIRAMVIYKTDKNSSNPYAQTVHTLFTKITNNDLPPSIRKLYNSSFVFGLHKDPIPNPNPKIPLKLRPIAVGGGLRRLMTSCIVKDNVNEFAEFLTPYNYAIGIKGGASFIHHTISLEIDKYVKRDIKTVHDNPPTRCAISLDICNMFNEISREEAMNIINTHFPHLADVTSLLLNEPTVCYYLNPDGKWKYFLQEEGLPQGCPFSPVFAALVLHTIIEKLDKKLRHRAQTRKLKKILLDDKEGGITNLLAYVDDLNAVVPHEDCLFFCTQFKKLANALGLRLNNEKSKILTSITGTSPIQHIPKHIQTEVKQCIQEFTNNKETTNGIKILGFPVGNKEFIKQNLKDTHENVTKTYTNLKKN